MPYTAMRVANACVVGEAYLVVRNLLDLIADNATVDDVDEFLTAYPHAVTGTQLDMISLDSERPYRLNESHEPIASPDDYVDWDASPVVRSSDQVLRVIASKGCHLKCKFCATTYRQIYKVNPNGDYLARIVSGAARRGDSISLITNDVAALPVFAQLPKGSNIGFQSLTIKAIRDDAVLEALVRTKPRISRFGVEGISERIRQAYGKPISNNELLDKLEYLHNHKVNTHLFYIVGSPYETADDWQNFAQFYERLARRIRWGVLRIKFTTFSPNAPTPLGYFIPSNDYYNRFQLFYQWVADNWASRHLFIVKPRNATTQFRNLMEAFGITKRQLITFQMDKTVDLAPRVEDAALMNWEIIQWYLPAAKRWALSRSYMRYMGALERRLPERST